MMNSPWLIIILSLIGIIDTAYLAYHSIKKTEAACLFFPQEWCRKVQQSKYSRLLGFPNSFAGLGMYVAIFIFTLTWMDGLTPFALVQGIVAIGFLFSAYFTYLQAFVLKAFCTWCVISAINFLILAVVVFL